MPRIRLELRRAWTKLRDFLNSSNLALFLVALILAFALWAWVTNQNDPEIDRTIPAVQVTAVGLPQAFDIVGPLPAVEIELQGPQSQVSTLAAGVVQARIDLHDVTQPGTYTRNVHVDAPRGIRVRQVVPEKITVQIARSSANAAPAGASSPGGVPAAARALPRNPAWTT